jgi:outer membrane protein assembly factor BamB
MRLAAMEVIICLLSCSQPIHLDWHTTLPGPSVSTPLVAPDFIAVGHEQGLSILALDGKIRCTFTTHRDVISAPKTDGKNVFFGSTNYVFYAVTPDCREVWKFPTGDRIKSDPLVTAGRVFVTSYDGHVYALNAETGEKLWVFPAASLPVAGAPSDDKTEVTSSAKAKQKAKARRGKKAEVVEAPPPQTPTNAPAAPVVPGDFSYSSPTIADGLLYVGNLDHVLYVLEAQTGVLKWRFEAEAPITSSPLVRDGLVYFGSNDNNVYAIDTATAKVVWKMATRDWVNSSPTLAEGVLYIGSNDRHVYAIDAVTGQPLWTFDTQGPAVAQPAVYADWVIAAGGSGDGSIYVINRGDGTLYWRYVAGGKIESDPVVVRDRFYVSSAEGVLYAFSFRTMPKA